MLFDRPETLAGPLGTPAIDLYADAPDLGGAASVQRVRLAARSLGASPHHHRLSSELFYVLDGPMWFLDGEEIRLVQPGSLVAVPPLTDHAFASADEPASALIILVPGVARFGYFRLLAGVAAGAVPEAALLAAQERYDNHFVDAPRWREHVTAHGLS